MALDLKSIRKELGRQGWSERQLGSGHWRFTPPDPTKKLVHYSGSPSDWRSIHNLIGQLRRQGFQWPPKGKGQR